MATKKKNEVAEVETTNGEVAIAEQTPEWMRKHSHEGTENVGSGDVEIPRLQLLQALSPEVTDGDEKPGVFYHSVLEEALGKQVRVIPIYTDIRYILWRPRHEGGGILARADDGVHWNPPKAKFTVKPDKGSDRSVVWETKPTVAESGLAEWGSYDPDNANSQPAATKMYNMVVYLLDFPHLSPAVVTLQRGAVGVAKKLMGKLKLAQAPSYGQIYNLSSIKDDTGQGDFFNYQFDRVGYLTDETLFEQMRAMYQHFKEDGVRIKDIENLEDEGTTGGDKDFKQDEKDIEM